MRQAAVAAEECPGSGLIGQLGAQDWTALGMREQKYGYVSGGVYVHPHPPPGSSGGCPGFPARFALRCMPCMCVAYYELCAELLQLA